ncbi:OmpA/MotB family protein [Aridibaculum aurantiacum]|uniref:OmpA/MotB family protein n=1 Tax=Aridibaculum aurantiacum TaxID=2810307 RepID=UPI001F62365C|nr:flagellar motor protein MotB [Aridibaculum aurantiacum]
MRKTLSVPVMVVCAALSLSSCVAKRHLVNAENNIQRLQMDSTQMSARINTLEQNVSRMEASIRDLEANRTSLQQQLSATRQEASSRLQDASTRLNLSAAQIADQQKRLEYMQQLIEQQRRATQELRKKVSDALGNFNTEELTVSTKNGKVYVSLQENLLFPSGSAVVNPKGRQALGTLAGVLNSNPEINVLIEGHTDSIPMRGRFADNWELSTARANAIVRILTDTYKVEPTRVTASGRAWYDPVDTNLTTQGRAKNRRTEIILEPRLDQLMELIRYGEEGTAGQ